MPQEIPFLSLVSPTKNIMSPQWTGLLEPRGTNTRRTKDVWMLRGLVLTTILNIFLFYKSYYPRATTPLDDFQMLYVLLSADAFPSSLLSPCIRIVYDVGYFGH
jgi:hypothetical protein